MVPTKLKSGGDRSPPSPTDLRPCLSMASTFAEIIQWPVWIVTPVVWLSLIYYQNAHIISGISVFDDGKCAHIVTPTFFDYFHSFVTQISNTSCKLYLRGWWSIKYLNGCNCCCSQRDFCHLQLCWRDRKGTVSSTARCCVPCLLRPAMTATSSMVTRHARRAWWTKQETCVHYWRRLRRYSHKRTTLWCF